LSIRVPDKKNLYKKTQQLFNVTVVSKTALLKKLADLEKTLADQIEMIRSLKEENAALKKYMFGSRSERRYFDKEAHLQSSLFNEAENTVLEEPNSPELSFQSLSEEEAKKKPGGRRPLPADLPRSTEEIKPADNKLKCRHCSSDLKKIGEAATEKLEIVPQKVFVKRIIRPKYKCTCCETEPAEIIMEPLPKMLLPKAAPGAGFAAYVVTGKFADRIPFYHMAKVLKRAELDISRADLSRWTIDIFEKHLASPLEKLTQSLFKTSYIQCDETRLQVLQKEGLQYMWAMHGRIGNRKIALFRYEPSRSAKFLTPLLKEFKGVFQTDGWGSYDTHLGPMPEVIHAGCNVHARRKFMDCEPSPESEFVIDQYSKIYKIESDLEKANAPPEVILETRREKAKPVFELLRSKMNDWALSFRPTGNFGKAVNYFINEYDKLIVYTDHPNVRPDTNLVENDIRPFAVGRKNWLFAGNEAGARASAAFYSLVQIASLNGWDPHQFLLDLFTEIENTDAEIDLGAFISNYS
jgi:transposase